MSGRSCSDSSPRPLAGRPARKCSPPPPAHPRGLQRAQKLKTPNVGSKDYKGIGNKSPEMHPKFDNPQRGIRGLLGDGLLNGPFWTRKILRVRRKEPVFPRQIFLLKSCQMTPKSGFCASSESPIGEYRGTHRPIFSRESGSLSPSPGLNPKTILIFYVRGNAANMPFPAEIPPGPPGGPRPRLVALPCPWIGGEGADLPAHVRKKCGPAARSPHALADFFLTPSTIVCIGDGARKKSAQCRPPPQS